MSAGISRTSFKYAEEARGCFGVAIRKIDDESYVGVKCNPFNYTEKKIESIPKYKQLIKNELASKEREGENPEHV